MIALDTNILIYACDKADPQRQQAALDLIASSTDGVLLWQVACEFVAASRKLRSQGFTVDDAWSAWRTISPCFRWSSRNARRLNGRAFSTRKMDGHSGTR